MTATRPHRGTLILILGLVSLLCCPILGLAPLLMGNGDLKEMQAGRMDPSGQGLTNAGRIIGIIALVWGVVQLLLYFLLGFTLVPMQAQGGG